MSKWTDWKNSVGDARPWHLIDHDKIIEDQSVIDKRMSICNSCEHLLLTKQCSKCLCFMPAKTRLLNAGCPIGKWNRED